MQLIKKNLTFLKAVAELPKKQAQQLLLYTTREQTDAIAEIAHNLLAKVLHLSDEHITPLKIHKLLIRKLADHTNTQSHRKLQKYLANKVQGVSFMLRSTLPRIEKAL